jgi:hypothetical protein
MSLSPQQLEELGDLLVDNFDDQGVELDQVVKFNLGSGLFVDYVGHGSPFRTTVGQLLAKTEQKGSTVKLFEGVIRFRPAVKEAVARILPEAVVAAPETAKQVAVVLKSVMGIRTRLGNASVRRCILNSCDELKKVVVDLDLLARYKALHDCLHILQLKHLRLLANAARLLRTDPSAAETIAEYLDQIRIQASNARTAAQHLPDTPGERDVEMGWVSALEAVVNGLHEALMTNDEKAAIASVYQLKAILRAQPARLDYLLVITARRAPLSKLVDTLQYVSEAVKNFDKSPPDLTNGIVAVQRLVPDQMGLLAEHTAWQQVTSELWQADEALYLGNSDSLEEFQYVWQSLWNKVSAIIRSDPTSTWAVLLNQHASEFIKAFGLPATPPVPAPVKARFSLFLRDAMFQFYTVDKRLLAQCAEIIKIGEPLQRLLEEASNEQL